MYLLVVIYGVAMFKKEINVALPGLILSGIGMLVSIYDYMVQKLPVLQSTGDACGLVPCNFQYVNYFGFISIPFLSGAAFMIIFILHLLFLRAKVEYIVHKKV